MDDSIIEITQDPKNSVVNKQNLMKEVVKQIKSCARKEYKFDWALSRIEQLENYIQSDESTKEAFANDQKKLDNAKIEIKMDEHDWQIKQPPKPQTTNYVIAGTAVILISAAIYYRYKRRNLKWYSWN